MKAAYLALKRRLRKALPWPIVWRVKRMREEIVAAMGERSVSRLARVYKSDKWGIHKYAPLYDQWFAPLRSKPITLLEIGVGGYDHPRRGARSLRMWKRYFRRGCIVGIDLHDKSPLEENRLRIFQGDQSDGSFLTRVAEEVGPFDIVIDDGSHVQSHIIASFETLFPLLKPGGIYAVEDTQTSYWPDYEGSTAHMLDVESAMNYFLRRVHEVNRAEWSRKEAPPALPDDPIASIAFYRNLILMTKRPADD